VSAPIIAIDGPAGSGKSTLTRALAEALDLPALETGAMYRAVTWAVLQAGVDPGDAAAVADVARRVAIEVGERRVLVDGPGGSGVSPGVPGGSGVSPGVPGGSGVSPGVTDVTEAIRGPEVTAAVSAVSANPQVREVLVELQRRWIEAHGAAVVEGRDIGTVVVPDAALKLFLVASEEERARRRREDEGGAGAVEQTLESIRRRDTLDASRAASPLVAAPDAVILDTTGRSVPELVAEVIVRWWMIQESA
jgi:CMP/dCMP kinase